MNDLGLDSLDHVEVIMAIEDEFGNLKFLPTVFLYFNSSLFSCLCTLRAALIGSFYAFL